MSSSRHLDLATKLIHEGEPRPRVDGAVGIPIFQSSTFEYGDDVGYDDIKYARLSNTVNHIALGEKLAAAENAEAALVTASGMAAISASLLTILEAGDHLLMQRGVYGGTHTLVTESLTRYGIEHDFVDPTDPDEWGRLLRPTTKAFYVETISNPLLNVPALEAVVEFSRANNLVSLIDNTVASPINFRPNEWGFDLSLHSGTKYLNGHNDVIAGVVIGSRERVESIRHNLNHFGGSLDPHACFLLHRGLKTLPVRMRHQAGSAQAIAEFLEGHSAVEGVYYPGLANHRGSLFDLGSGVAKAIHCSLSSLQRNTATWRLRNRSAVTACAGANERPRTPVSCTADAGSAFSSFAP